MTRITRNTLLVGVLVAVAIGGGVSYFASGSPDGLEKTQEELGIADPAHAEVAHPPSPFEEYALEGVESPLLSNAVAGIAGSLLVLAVLVGFGAVVRRRGEAEPEA